MALELDIGANTRAAQKNIQNLGEALEEVSDALDDMARDGARSGDKLEDTGAADATVETFAQLDELLVTLGASVGRS